MQGRTIILRVLLLAFSLPPVLAAPVNPGDVDNDGIVNQLDLDAVVSDWRKTSGFDTAADSNDDGVINIFDLVAVATNWNATYVTATCEAISPGQCWYIATTGNDTTGNGSFENPFMSRQAVGGNASPGDVIYYRGGTYNTSHLVLAGTYEGPETSWSPEPLYSWGRIGVSGNATHPITIKAYPNETVIFDIRDGADVYPGNSTSGVFEMFDGWSTVNAFALNSDTNHQVIDGFNIRGQRINIWGGTAPSGTHNITIKNNRIYDLGIVGGNNPGIIRIDRGDNIGATDIYIINNTLHDLYDSTTSGHTDWFNTSDAQHFGAVTTLSGEVYGGYDNYWPPGGTRRIVIENNTIYNIPNVFFFKNPSFGPIEIRNNVIFNATGMGNMLASNMNFTENLVYAVPGGANPDGWPDVGDSRIEAMFATNWSFTHNTFANNFNYFPSSRYGYNYVATNNIFQGFTGEIVWTTPGIFGTRTNISLLTPRYSNYTVDENCYVTDQSTFIHTSRLDDDWSNPSEYNITDVQTLFGWAFNSTVVLNEDATDVFEDPAAGDFAVQTSHPCEGYGRGSS